MISSGKRKSQRQYVSGFLQSGYGRFPKGSFSVLRLAQIAWFTRRRLLTRLQLLTTVLLNFQTRPGKALGLRFLCLVFAANTVSAWENLATLNCLPMVQNCWAEANPDPSDQ